MSKSASLSGSSSRCHNSASEFIAESSLFRVTGIILGLAFQSDTFVSISLRSFCSFLQAFRISSCGSLARHGCLLATSLHFCVKFRLQVLICKSNAEWPKSLMIRSFVYRVALDWVAVDASVIITSSSRFQHSAVCPCPDIGNPAR